MLATWEVLSGRRVISAVAGWPASYIFRFWCGRGGWWWWRRPRTSKQGENHSGNHLRGNTVTVCDSPLSLTLSLSMCVLIYIDSRACSVDGNYSAAYRHHQGLWDLLGHRTQTVSRSLFLFTYTYILISESCRQILIFEWKLNYDCFQFIWRLT